MFNTKNRVSRLFSGLIVTIIFIVIAFSLSTIITENFNIKIPRFAGFLGMGIYWLLLSAGWLFFKFVKNNSDSETTAEYEEIERQNEEDAKNSPSILSIFIFLILIIVGVYLTAWILK